MKNNFLYFEKIKKINVVTSSMCPTEVVVESGGWLNVFWLVVDLDGQSYVNIKANDGIANGVKRL